MPAETTDKEEENILMQHNEYNLAEEEKLVYIIKNNYEKC
jgi:hypothetical protein